MNFDKPKLLLDKIAALIRSMELSPDHVAPIEKELMKNYIMQLYEAFLETEPQTESPALHQPKVELLKSKNAGLHQASQAVPVPEKIREAHVEPIPEKPVERPVPKEPSAAPTLDELPEAIKKITEEQEEEPTPVPAKPDSEPAEKAPVTKFQIDPEIEDIFDIPTAKELSEKLGQLPIQDLRKAFGLNEKIFTINELFGGNQIAFNDVIDTLNGMGNFDKAKNFLAAEVASKYDWASKGKKKKAKEFVKLISRRYA